ncbi:pyridoxal 5'-phosphate synthase glutaminase subunit PdxT [Pectinatus sottacetonis]|uniref:pyridoxal 5'-phosphate synthase glutaminase subunit PdxT n=1 Tax=Pectinatus sottacetonis TaxID=1002795 RepID=UPI0018C7AB3E|nr:pyridoxal 5'-phosphate synthase glutaminase subunit PdxT [Pectinatus sottacetonis]
MKTIGVLALQGAVAEHLNKLEQLGAGHKEIRNINELKEIDGIIIPGGESTAIGKLLTDFKLMEPLNKAIQNGLPVWGTCAGMILLAKKICGQKNTYLNTMDITVRRNAYGSQLDSFITQKLISSIAPYELPLVFIRAPYIESVTDSVSILAKVNSNIVAARQKNMLATSFHPELTDDTSFHKYFLSMC